MPDKTELVLLDADGEVLDTITTTLPSEISALRGRGYTTAEEHKQLAQARQALAKSDAAGDDNAKSGDASKKTPPKGDKSTSTTGS